MRALPAPIERNAYFIAAELLTNAVKHAEATAIRLRVGTRDEGPAGRLDRRLGHRQRSRRRGGRRPGTGSPGSTSACAACGGCS